MTAIQIINSEKPKEIKYISKTIDKGIKIDVAHNVLLIGDVAFKILVVATCFSF